MARALIGRRTDPAYPSVFGPFVRLLVVATIAWSAPARADDTVACTVALECAAWTDLVELHAALRGEPTHDATLSLRGCVGTTARLEATWSDGRSRSRVVDLADVPIDARARTVALLLAELASLGPEAPSRIRSSDVASRELAPPRARSAAGERNATIDDDTVDHATVDDDSVDHTTVDDRATAAAPASIPADAEQPATPPDTDDAEPERADTRATAIPANAASRSTPSRDTRPHLTLDLGARAFLLRRHPFLTSGTLQLRWRWLLVGAELLGARRDRPDGTVGIFATLGRIGLRTPWEGARFTVSGEAFAELGLVRTQGRPNGDALGAVERAPAVGGGLAVRVERRVGPLRLGLVAELDLLRGMVAAAVDPFGEPREVVGVHGPALRIALSVATL